MSTTTPTTTTTTNTDFQRCIQTKTIYEIGSSDLDKQNRMKHCYQCVQAFSEEEQLRKRNECLLNYKRNILSGGASLTFF
jgi:hypothetical protein